MFNIPDTELTHDERLVFNKGLNFAPFSNCTLVFQLLGQFYLLRKVLETSLNIRLMIQERRFLTWV